MVRTQQSVEATIGVGELLAGNERARRRARERRRRQRAAAPRQGIVRMAVQVGAELLLTAGVLLLLFAVWELWWTNIAADNLQQEAVHRFAREVQGPLTPAGAVDYGAPKVSAALPEGTVFGIAYIPRFGAGYSRPLVQGTTPAQLDSLGLGHYEASAMPGAVGNFAVAGHRQTHGAVLDAIHTLVPGDRIYIQTRDGYYTYVFRNNQIVLPNRTDVILPVPTMGSDVPVQRLLTMTSCNPRFGAEERFVAYSVLESWQPAGAGPPAAIAEQVALARGKG